MWHVHLQNAEEAAELKKRRAFRKFSYRGIDLDKYVLMAVDEGIALLDDPRYEGGGDEASGAGQAC